MTRYTREEVIEYLEAKMPGQWDEWNVEMTWKQWDREDQIARDLEQRTVHANEMDDDFEVMSDEAFEAKWNLTKLEYGNTKYEHLM